MNLANKKLPDTPWHVGYTKKEEDDPRRHKARCIHIGDKICKCGKSGSYMTKCAGSAHCHYYCETLSEWNRFSEENKTAEDLERDRINDYKKIVQIKKENFIKDKQNYFQYRDVKDIRECPICLEHLVHTKKTKAYCSFCKVFFINESDINQYKKLSKCNDVFVMGKYNTVNSDHILRNAKVGCCNYMNKRGRCLYENSHYHGKKCNKYRCENFE